MSEDRHQDDSKAPFRRSRKDQEGRDYICGCGKKYLSYPALYTHIKTKHDGQQPLGTQKTGNGTAVKRIKPKIEQQLIRKISTMLNKQDLSLLKQLPNCQGFISFQKRLKKENLPKQVFEYYSNSSSWKSTWKMDKSMCVQGVLLMFLLSAGQHICQPLLSILVEFSRIVFNCFSQYGSQIFKNVFKQKVESMKLSKPFSPNQCRYLPIICDFMVRFYIPAECKDTEAPIMQIILDDFVRWMRKNGLTSIQVKLKRGLTNKVYNSQSWKILKQYNQPTDLNDVNDQNSINSNADQISNNQENNQSEKSDYQYERDEQEFYPKANQNSDGQFSGRADVDLNGKNVSRKEDQ